MKGFVEAPNLANRNINQWDAAALLKMTESVPPTLTKDFSHECVTLSTHFC